MSLYIMSLANMKSVLGITDTADDALLTIWMEQLQGRFDEHCQRRFLYSASETEYFDGGTTSLFVRRWPIASIGSIIIDADQAWSADDAIDSMAYRVNHKRGSLLYGTAGVPWPCAPQGIRVVYAGGFVKSDGTAAAHVDDYELKALQRALLLQANFEWRNRKQLGLSQVSAQGNAINMAPCELLREVKDCLVPFRRVL